MTWGRGLLRLWIVLSVMWMMIVFLYQRPDEQYREYRATEIALGDRDGLYTRDDLLRAAENAVSANDRRAAEELKVQADKIAETGQLYKSAERNNFDLAKSKLKSSAGFALIPIFLTFSIGAALLWAIRGFRGNSNP